MSERPSQSEVPLPEPLERPVVRAAVRQLKWVFWGMLLVAIDIPPVWATIAGRWRIDPLNDLVGWLLIVVAVARLGRIRVDEPWLDRYGSAMKAVKWVAIVSATAAAMGHVVFAHPDTLDLLLAILGLAQLAAGVLFAVCMWRLCTKAELPRAARGWSIFLAVFLTVYVIPSAFYHYSAYVTQLGGQEYRFDVTLMSVGGSVLTGAMTALMGWALWRMAREMAGRGVEDADAG